MAGKLALTLILLSSIVLALPIVHGTSQSPENVQKWYRNLHNKKHQLTKLRLYFHDIQSGNNPTAVMVARANKTSDSPTLFGALYAIDDPLTVGPEPNSTLIGRAQGFYGSTGMKELSLLMTMNYVFTSGKYNGSTLTVLGRNPAMELYREFPIVGGSGFFRLARGTVIAKTYWVDFKTGDAIVEHNLIVMHY